MNLKAEAERSNTVHFVIIGNGVAGASAAIAIREREPKARITMISGEAEYFFSRTALMYAFMDRMNLRDLEPFERKVYDKQKISRIKDWVIDLDAQARTLRLRSGNSVTYDRLLLATGSVPNVPAWRGLENVRDGAVHFVSLQDLEKCERLTPSTQQAVVVGGGLIGVELVECLVVHGKKVTFLVREPWYWPVALGGKEAAMISDHIRGHGVDLRLEHEVGEVSTDGNGRVRAVKTLTGEEFPCQLLGISIGVRPAVEWTKQLTTAPRVGRGIQVSPDFTTSLPDVWAAGDCAEIHRDGEKPFVEQIWYSAKRQGELAARAMLGDPMDYRPPIFYNSAKFFEIEYTTVGKVNGLPSDAVEFYTRLPGKEVSMRIMELGGAVVGFNMLGSRWNHTYFSRWIAERRSLDYVMDHLREAQFDVEFGREEVTHAITEFRRTQRNGQSAATASR